MMQTISLAAQRGIDVCGLFTTFLLLTSMFFSGPLQAEAWKPLCPVGSSCHAPYQRNFYSPNRPGNSYLNSDAIGPLVSSKGLILLHSPVTYPDSLDPMGHIFRWSPLGLEDLGDASPVLSDFNSVQLADGNFVAIGGQSIAVWSVSENEASGFEWNQLKFHILNGATVSFPPVAIGNAIYLGIKLPSGPPGNQWVGVSVDQGIRWEYHDANIHIGEDRYNLLSNPEQDALWAISSEHFASPGSLWESTDHGVNWTQVDDGSFPDNTVRVVHDPSDTQVSYALTDHGLFVSLNRGVSWQSTALTEAVHGLAFVDRVESLSRAMVAGTNAGISLSVDDGASWSDMSKGLFEGPHTVTYADGQLLATGNEGYFTCNELDCDGLAMPIPPEEAVGMVEVTEYYNTITDHYFMTGMDGEKAMIDQGQAGPGWVRTGESFLGWNLRSNPKASNVCRFYGSYVLGPNSHFYSDTAMECRFLQELQEATPDDKPRWNFEGWAMSVLPRAASDEQACPEEARPVYRAYNNGYALGKDSNHRYVTDRTLLEPMEAEGWIIEGIAFCSPLE